MTTQITITIDTWLKEWIDENKPPKIATRSEWVSTLLVKGMQKHKMEQQQDKTPKLRLKK